MRALLLLTLVATAAAAEPVTLNASDGTRVYGEWTSAQGKPKGVLVLFHQAHSNHVEYAPIQVRLAKAGYASLAIDQRSGGEMFGAQNRTAIQFQQLPPYQATMPDLVAALEFAVQRNGGKPVIVVGSSYSASLVFSLAAEHPKQVRAVVAFSPGEYFQDKHLVRDAARTVQVPVFVTSGSDSDEVSKAKEIVDVVPGKKEQYVPKAGVHGASTLRADRNSNGAEANWAALMKFLDSLR